MVRKRLVESAGNVCEKCAKKPHTLSLRVADTGICSICNQMAECWDFELIELYKSLSIPDEVIWGKLPRLRDSNLTGSTRQSLAKIWRLIKEIDSTK